jgi:hypothetical protein
MDGSLVFNPAAFSVVADWVDTAAASQAEERRHMLLLLQQQQQQKEGQYGRRKWAGVGAGAATPKVRF